MPEQQTVKLTFRNRGLRSYIDLDLCSRCPRQDNKGCCGHYSPIFYLVDLAYLYTEAPEMIDLIFSMPHLTVLDYSVTVNKVPDDDGYICPMLDKSSGCRLPQIRRESVCRHFICCGVPWQTAPSMRYWAEFFEKLADYEIAVNQEWAENLQARGLTLREPAHRLEIFQAAAASLQRLLAEPPDLIAGSRPDESYELLIRIVPDTEWIL